MGINWDNEKKVFMWNGETINLANSNGTFTFNTGTQKWEVKNFQTVTDALTPKIPDSPGPNLRDAEIDQAKLDLKRIEDMHNKEAAYLNNRVGKLEEKLTGLSESISRLTGQMSYQNSLTETAGDDRMDIRRRLYEIDGDIDHIKSMVERKLDKPSAVKALDDAEAYVDDYLRATGRVNQVRFARKRRIKKKIDRLNSRGNDENVETTERKSYTVHKVVALVTMLLGIPGILALAM